MAAKPNSDKSSIWYSPEVKNLSSSARELLEKYSHISPELVESHVLEVRDRGWEIYPYPCIGLMRFLELSLCHSPSYSLIVSRLQAGATLLDIGCCFAQDLRKLVYDGAPSTNLYGVELQKEFLELGYDLFLDRDTFDGKFFVADVFDLTGPLKELEGKIDMIHVGMFLHLFDWKDQVKICERIVASMKSRKGGLVVGRQIGHLEGLEGPQASFQGGTIFRHNAESFERMWKEVGEKTRSEWDVRAKLDEGQGITELPTLEDDKRKWLTFEVERLR